MITSKLIMASADTPFYLNPTFFVALSVTLFMALLLWKGVFKALGSSLDDRAAKINDELEEARRLREEAQALLASYHRKQKEAESLAEDIVSQARKDAEAMAANSRKDLGERLERRAKQAEEKIANAEAKALADVRSQASDMAVEMAKSILGSKLTAANHSKLIKEGIAEMGKVLN